MEIHVYLQDGHVTKSAQDDPVIARKILEAIHPNRLFSAPQLLIGSDHALTAFQPQLIVRVDLMTSGGLLARGREAGYIILNPASLVRFTSYVGLQEMPANALPMRRLND